VTDIRRTRIEAILKSGRADGGGTMPLPLGFVNERFQQVRDHAGSLFESDENFRDLCEDYEDCARTLARLESSSSSSRPMFDEYTALLLRLERELLRYLEEHPRPGEA
jgi:hypothetical protein